MKPIETASEKPVIEVSKPSSTGLQSLRLIVFVIFASFFISGTVLWENTIGGGKQDSVRVVVPLSDGGSFVLGNTMSGKTYDKTDSIPNDQFWRAPWHSDVWGVKLDGSGSIVWQITLGGSKTDVVLDAIEAPDSSIYVFATSNSPISGNKTLNTLASNRFDIWLIHLDRNGNIIGQDIIGDANTDEGWVNTFWPWEFNRMKVFLDDTVFTLIGSSITSTNAIGVFAMQMSTTGNVIRSKIHYGGALMSAQKSGDGYLIGVDSRSNSSSAGSFWAPPIDYNWVARLDSTLAMDWNFSLDLGDTNSIRSSRVSIHDIIEKGTSNVLLCATTSNWGEDRGPAINRILAGTTRIEDSSAYWLVEVDRSANIVWEKSISLSNWYWKTLASNPRVFEEGSGRYRIFIDVNDQDTNNTLIPDSLNKGDSYILTLVIDTAGNVSGMQSFGSSSMDDVGDVAWNGQAYVIGASSDGPISLDKSEARKGNWGCDYWVVNYFPDTSQQLYLTRHSSTIPSNAKDYFKVFPNPSSGNLSISWSQAATSTVYITDVRGRRLYYQQLPFGNNFELNLSLSTGIYNLHLVLADQVYIRSVVLE